MMKKLLFFVSFVSPVGFVDFAVQGIVIKTLFRIYQIPHSSIIYRSVYLSRASMPRQKAKGKKAKKMAKN
jgi:hypothetical protein